MITRLLYVLLLILLVTFALPAWADDLECEAGQVKVCFADGDDAACHCQVRTIVMSDTAEVEIDCVDEDDDGNCD